jgi:hypothetical protein
MNRIAFGLSAVPFDAIENNRVCCKRMPETKSMDFAFEYGNDLCALTHFYKKYFVTWSALGLQKVVCLFLNLTRSPVQSFRLVTLAVSLRAPQRSKNPNRRTPKTDVTTNRAETFFASLLVVELDTGVRNLLTDRINRPISSSVLQVPIAPHVLLG